MYRTMIVEDNAIFRYAIRTIIDWEQMGFRLVGEAVNGKQALERLEEQPADLLITDISMPEMNGIELIQAVKTHSPSTQVIVLSSYDEFHFVKDALKLGAMDYLLKHDLEEETLLKALAAARERIAGERTAEGRTASSGREGSEYWLARALLGQLEPSEWEERAAEWPAGFVRAPLAVMSLRLPDHEPAERYRQELLDAGRGLGLDFAVVHPAPRRAAVIVGFGRERSETRLAAMAHQAACRLSKPGAPSGAPRLVGVSRSGWGIKELPHLYAEAETALFRRIYRGLDVTTVFPYTPSPKPSSSPRPLAGMVQDICVAIRTSSCDSVRSMTDRWLAELKRQQPEEAALKRMWMDLFAFLVVTAAENRVPLEDMEHWQRTVQETLTGLAPVETLHELFVSRCLRILSSRETGSADRKEIQLAMAFVDTRLQEEFTVADIARHLSLSPNYLSNLFKQHTGKRLVEWIQERRVEAAKKLLSGTPLKVYEVAEKVGFKDASYFCKVFKDVTGMTVSEYKKGP